MNKAFLGQDARSRVLSGAKLAFDIVKTVQGPRSGNVGIGHRFYGPDITHDGVTVLEAIDYDDSAPEELGMRIGIELMKEASRNVNNLAGDGTTSVAGVLYQTLNESNRYIVAEADAQAIRRGIDKAAELALKELKKHVTKIKPDSPELKHVALTSADNEKVGSLVAEVVATVGKNGNISVEVDEGAKLEKEIVEGFSFDYGLASPVYATDQNKKEAEYELPAIVLISGMVMSPMELKPLIDQIYNAGQEEIIFIIDEMDREVKHALSQNRIDGAKIAVVKAPGHGESRQDALADIAAFTGATVLNTDVPLAVATTAHVGRCGRIVVGTDKTVIYEGKGDTTQRIKDLKEKRGRRQASELEKARIDERIAKLSSKAAIIKVGGISEAAISELKDRIDDTVAAAQGALKEGVVPGGGITLVYLSDHLQAPRSLKDDEVLGFNAFKKALAQPFRQILLNAGLNADAIRERVTEANAAGPVMGVDVKQNSRHLIKMQDVGVIDPVRVTRAVISQAASLAGQGATMDTIIVEVPEKSIDNYA